MLHCLYQPLQSNLLYQKVNDFVKQSLWSALVTLHTVYVTVCFIEPKKCEMLVTLQQKKSFIFYIKKKLPPQVEVGL